MLFFLAFLLVAGLEVHGDYTEIVGYCRELEATQMIKYLLFFTSQYSLVGVTRGCKGQSSTYFISILSVVGRIREGLAVYLRLRVSGSVCPDRKKRGYGLQDRGQMRRTGKRVC